VRWHVVKCRSGDRTKNSTGERQRTLADALGELAQAEPKKADGAVQPSPDAR